MPRHQTTLVNRPHGRKQRHRRQEGQRQAGLVEDITRDAHRALEDPVAQGRERGRRGQKREKQAHPEPESLDRTEGPSVEQFRGRHLLADQERAVKDPAERERDAEAGQSGGWVDAPGHGGREQRIGRREEQARRRQRRVETREAVEGQRRVGHGDGVGDGVGRAPRRTAARRPSFG